jgi:dihydrofolate reductase
MNLLRYHVAMSLDGFIAREDGSYDWIPPDPGVDFVALFAEFDSFVMGRKTFELCQSLGDQNPVKGLTVLVVSTTLVDPRIPGVEVVRTDIVERVRQEKARVKKDVWLFGGGSLFRYLLDEGLVERVEVSVIPVLIGSGIPLIADGGSQSLRLLSHCTLPSGIAQLAYATTVAYEG